MAKMIFNGQSQELKETQIVPTLHTPIEQGSNVVWCASFLCAWKILQKEIAGEPVEVGICRLENSLNRQIVEIVQVVRAAHGDRSPE